MSCTPVPVRNRFTADGVTVAFQYTFDDTLSDESDVLVSVTDGDSTVVKLEGIDYTLNPNNKTVTFIVAPNEDSIIVIKRCTTRNREVDYTGGTTILSEENLDEDCNRLTAVTQEIEGQTGQALSLNEAGTAWDAEGLEIENGAPATDGDSLVTLNQVQNMIAGGETAEIDNGSVICHEGDGAETDFAITGFQGLNARQIFVYVEGVIQSVCDEDPAYEVLGHDDSGYPGPDGGPDYIRFTTPPVLESHIEIRIIRGTVISTLGANAISDADQISDDIINEDHINVGAGADKRFLIFDTAGDPTARVAVPGDISGFTAAVVANRLSAFAAPDAEVGMGSQQITDLSAGTADAHAVNKGQMDTKVNNRLQAQRANIPAGTMPTVEDDSVTLVSGLGFIPDVFVYNARFKLGSGSTDTDYHGTWIVLFQGSGEEAQRTLSPGRFADNVQPPTLRFKRTPSGTAITVKLIDAGDLEAWTLDGYLALKFGDAA